MFAEVGVKKKGPEQMLTAAVKKVRKYDLSITYDFYT